MQEIILTVDDINWDSFEKKLLRFYNLDFISTWNNQSLEFDCINLPSVGIPIRYINLTNEAKEKVRYIFPLLKTFIIGYVHTQPRCISCGETSEFQQICSHCLKRPSTWATTF